MQGETRSPAVTADSPVVELASQLNQIYSTRADKVLFVKGDSTLNFESVAEVIDMSRALGIDRVGILTPGLKTN